MSGDNPSSADEAPSSPSPSTLPRSSNKASKLGGYVKEKAIAIGSYDIGGGIVSAGKATASVLKPQSSADKYIYLGLLIYFIRWQMGGFQANNPQLIAVEMFAFFVYAVLVLPSDRGSMQEKVKDIILLGAFLALDFFFFQLMGYLPQGWWSSRSLYPIWIYAGIFIAVRHGQPLSFIPKLVTWFFITFWLVIGLSNLTFDGKTVQEHVLTKVGTFGYSQDQYEDIEKEKGDILGKTFTPSEVESLAIQMCIDKEKDFMARFHKRLPFYQNPCVIKNKPEAERQLYGLAGQSAQESVMMLELGKNRMSARIDDEKGVSILGNVKWNYRFYLDNPGEDEVEIVPSVMLRKAGDKEDGGQKGKTKWSYTVDKERYDQDSVSGIKNVKNEMRFDSLGLTVQVSDELPDDGNHYFQERVKNQFIMSFDIKDIDTQTTLNQLFTSEQRFSELRKDIKEVAEGEQLYQAYDAALKKLGYSELLSSSYPFFKGKRNKAFAYDKMAGVSLLLLPDKPIIPIREGENTITLGVSFFNTAAKGRNVKGEITKINELKLELPVGMSIIVEQCKYFNPDGTFNIDDAYLAAINDNEKDSNQLFTCTLSIEPETFSDGNSFRNHGFTGGQIIQNVPITAHMNFDYRISRTTELSVVKEAGR